MSLRLCAPQSWPYASAMNWLLVGSLRTRWSAPCLSTSRSNAPQGIGFKTSCIRLFSCRMALVLPVFEFAGKRSNHRRISAMHFVQRSPTGQSWDKPRDDNRIATTSLLLQRLGEHGAVEAVPGLGAVVRRKRDVALGVGGGAVDAQGFAGDEGGG